MIFFPYDMPEKFSHFCYATNRFYLDEPEYQILWKDFCVAIHLILTNGSKDPYELLLAASANQDLKETLRLSELLQIAKQPNIIQIIRKILGAETIVQMGNTPLEKLYKAPYLMHEQDTIYSLVVSYPEQAQTILEMAILHNAPVDWHKIQTQRIQPALCCLALKTNHFHTLYHEGKKIEILIYWLLLDPIGAIEALEKHPAPEEKFQILSLHGDPMLFSQFAHELVSIRHEEVRDPIKLMFGQQVHTRKSLSIPPDLPYISYDPIHVQALCEKIQKPACYQGRGRAIELLNLREAIHANH